MEKRIFVSWFKFSKEFVNHLKFLINDDFNCEELNYKGYYYLYLYSLLACDNDVVLSRGQLPVLKSNDNEYSEYLDYKRIAIILNLHSISEAKDFCDKLNSLGLLTADGKLVDIEMFYGGKFTRNKLKKDRIYYDEKLRLLHSNGKIFYKVNGKAMLINCDLINDEDLKAARSFAAIQKSLKSYEVRPLMQL